MTANVKWCTDAEMMMAGFVVEVESKDHLEAMVSYALITLRNYSPDEAKRGAHKIVKTVLTWCNPEDVPVSHVTANSTAFGDMLTFVRDEEVKTTEDVTIEGGVLTYVYNLSYPDCSELGYSHFKCSNGKVMRFA